jgi:hypothetical protein
VSAAPALLVKASRCRFVSPTPTVEVAMIVWNLPIPKVLSVLKKSHAAVPPCEASTS